MSIKKSVIQCSLQIRAKTPQVLLPCCLITFSCFYAHQIEIWICNYKLYSRYWRFIRKPLLPHGTVRTDYE